MSPATEQIAGVRLPSRPPAWLGETETRDAVDGKCPHDGMALEAYQEAGKLLHCSKCCRVWQRDTGVRLPTCWWAP